MVDEQAEKYVESLLARHYYNCLKIRQLLPPSAKLTFYLRWKWGLKYYKIFNYKKRLVELPKPLKLNLNDYLEEFMLQLNDSKLSFTNLDFERERAINFDLSYIFTTKEIEIIKKVLSNESLNKTEYETFSRKIKKKLAAIMRLNGFSQTLSNMRPIY